MKQKVIDKDGKYYKRLKDCMPRTLGVIEKEESEASKERTLDFGFG